MATTFKKVKQQYVTSPSFTYTANFYNGLGKINILYSGAILNASAKAPPPFEDSSLIKKHQPTLSLLLFKNQLPTN
jgi:hypothetical protein